MKRLFFGIRVRMSLDGWDLLSIEQLQSLLEEKEKAQDYEACIKIKEKIKEKNNNGNKH